MGTNDAATTGVGHAARGTGGFQLGVVASATGVTGVTDDAVGGHRCCFNAGAAGPVVDDVVGAVGAPSILQRRRLFFDSSVVLR